MCHALFIASAHELPLVSPTNPLLLSIEVLEAHHEAVRAHFPKNWCVRYAGSSSGCSCDFHGENSEPSRLALHHYLSILPASFQIMLYDCWEGEAQEPIQESMTASIQDIAHIDELITERRLITLLHANNNSESTMPDVMKEIMNKRNGETEEEGGKTGNSRGFFSRLCLVFPSVSPFLLFLFFRFRQR